MRVGTCLVLVLVVVSADGQTSSPGGTRYGIAVDLQAFPQATAREALASALKAIAEKNFAYLLAQLADPTFVDDRVQRVYGGRFAEQVLDTQSRLDPPTVKLLQRFLKDGKITLDMGRAAVQRDDVPDRSVHLVQKDGRWYLEHRFGK